MADAVADSIAYHERTKHQPEQSYANRQDGLDWANQPGSSCRFTGAPVFRFPFACSDEPLHAARANANWHIRIFDETAPSLPSGIWLDIPPDVSLRWQALGLLHRFCLLFVPPQFITNQRVGQVLPSISTTGTHAAKVAQRL
jgi:hypothetical protein